MSQNATDLLEDNPLELLCFEPEKDIPIKSEILIQQTQQLFDSLSWQKIIDLSLFDIEDNSFNLLDFVSTHIKFLSCTQRLLEDPEGKIEDNQMLTIQQKLNEMEKLVNDKRLLKPKSIKTLKPEAHVNQADLELQIMEWKNELENLNYLKRLFRLNENSPIKPAFQELTDIAQVIKYSESFPNNTIPQALLSLVRAKLFAFQKKEFEVCQCQKKLTQSKLFNHEQTAEQLQICGIKTEPDQQLIITEQEIRTLLAEIPPIFLQNTIIERPSSSHINSIQQKKPGDQEYIGKKVGDFIPTVDDDNNLIQATIKIYEQCSLDTRATEEEQEIAKNNFKETLYHEIGHRIQFDLTPEEMQKWITINTDKKNITQYVKDSRKIDHSKGVREDFCESFLTFMMTPKKLLHESKERFNFFYVEILKYMPAEQYTLVTNKIIKQV